MVIQIVLSYTLIVEPLAVPQSSSFATAAAAFTTSATPSSRVSSRSLFVILGLRPENPDKKEAI